MALCLHKNRQYSMIIFLLVFIIFRGSPWDSCCPQVQVIKHRPRQIQKAYPGLLEPSYSYTSASNKPLTSRHCVNRSTAHVVTTQVQTSVPSFSHTRISDRRSISLLHSRAFSTRLVALFTWRHSHVTTQLSSQTDRQ